MVGSAFWKEGRLWGDFKTIKVQMYNNRVSYFRFQMHVEK